ncbi:unnamed protein product [Camellia sinensis]
MPSPLLAEARTLLEAIKWAGKAKIQCLSIFTNCQLLVDSFVTKNNLEWEVDLVVQDVLVLSKFFTFLSVTKVGRALVEPAHQLAKSVKLLSHE